MDPFCIEESYSQLLSEFPDLLHYGSAKGMKNVCFYLINYGADIGKLDGNGWTPLMYCTRNGHLDVVKLLLKVGAETKLPESCGSDLLNLAIASGNLSLVQFILDVIESKESKSNHPTALALACSFGFNDIVNALLVHSPKDINSQINKSGMTPLMLAVCERNITTVKILLEHNVDVQIENGYGHKAIDIALFLNEESLIHLLEPSQHGLNNFNSIQEFPYHEGCEKVNIEKSARIFKHLFPSYLSLPPKYSPNTRPNMEKREMLYKLECGVTMQNHPLTPNVCISPVQKGLGKSPRKQNSGNSFQFPISRKRSKSLDSCKDHEQTYSLSPNDNILEFILKSEGLSEYHQTFKDQEITLKTFLTMDEDDLITVGIKEDCKQKKLLKLITHYKRIFSF